jgi:molybdate transport system substrate-binding protein
VIVSPSRRSLVLASLAVASIATQAKTQTNKPLRIAAASDLKFAMGEIVQAYKAISSQPIDMVFGSSGLLTAQIEQGAPFDLFMSADQSYVTRLAAKRLTQGAGALYARGRIALFVANSSPLKPDGTLADLRAALRDGRLKKLAIANPDHAPYGRAAREALIHSGLWATAQPRLVLGENVSQATQFASTGDAQAGIIAWSLALAPDVAKLGKSALIAGNWHKPLDQRMVVLKRAQPTATAFYAYLRSPPARAIFKRFGFTLPTDKA